MTRMAYSIKDAAMRGSVSHHTLYRAIGDGRLRAKRLGSRTLILADDLQAFLDGLPDLEKPRRGPKTRAEATNG
jgi:excisionase family DNA binding protein